MANAQATTLVFKDQMGNYILVAEETWQRGRVPVENSAEVDRLLAESDDVAGHSPFLIGVFVGTILGGGAAIGAVVHGLHVQEATDAVKNAISVAGQPIHVPGGSGR